MVVAEPRHALPPRLPRLGERGSAAIEFALIGPLFLLLLVGIVVYGGWFWLAQGVQHLAAEGARAAIAGLDGPERERLARAAIAADAGQSTMLSADDLSVVVASRDDGLRVEVSYDAHDHPLMALAGLLPPPPLTITRDAVIRIGTTA